MQKTCGEGWLREPIPRLVPLIQQARLAWDRPSKRKNPHRAVRACCGTDLLSRFGPRPGAKRRGVEAESRIPFSCWFHRRAERDVTG